MTQSTDRARVQQAQTIGQDASVEEMGNVLQGLLQTQTSPVPYTAKLLGNAVPVLVSFDCMVQDNGLSMELCPSKMTLERDGESMDVNPFLLPAYQAQNWVPAQDSRMDCYSSSLLEVQPYFCSALPFKLPDEHSIDVSMDQLSVSENAPVKWSSSVLSKLPDPSQQCAAIVKTLFTDQTIKLNQMIRVVGLLDLNRPEAEEESKMDQGQEDPLHQDAFQNVPIIHALSIKELSVEELTTGSTEKLSSEQMETARSMLLSQLTTILNGDEIAAEFLLLHLISRIEHRQTGINSGYFPLNLCHLTQEIAAQLRDLLPNLLPLSTCLPLTLDNLNKNMFMAPEMDRDMSTLDVSFTGLCAGRLQVPDGTLVIVDETVLETGKLEERGIVNLNQMKHVLDMATLPVILGQGTSLDLDVDLKFLLLSEGRSLISVECTLPVESVMTSDAKPMSVSDMTLARQYLSQATTTPYQLSPEMAERITAQFSDGQSPNQKITGQDLLRRLESARLMARSFGSQTLTDPMWATTQEIESVRVERLQKLPAKKQLNDSAPEPVLR